MARSHFLRTTSGSGLQLVVLLCCVCACVGQYYRYPLNEITLEQVGVEPLAPETRSSRCYNELGQAQKCVPEFVNAAFGRPVDVTNTCGVDRPQEYCLQTGGYGSQKACEVCNAYVPALAHPPHYLTDFNNNDNHTWWQSETMFEGIQFPNQVNITLNLGKSFDITYVRLFYHSPRPESFAIFKRTTYGDNWTPYQYYSATCRDTYGIPDSTYVRREDETRALCTSEFSDISPLTGGNVAFSTLEGRPSAYVFEQSPELQDWVTATEIRIILDRLNTFRDEVFGDTRVLRSYFYAITDLAVGGRCKCNGHASECVESTGVDGQSQLVCRCEHNTAGRDCEECLPFYNDAPWGRATSNDAKECRPCNCNGYSNRCYFDQELFDRTGHGGYCLDCAANRAGPNCERCRDNYYERQDGVCIACNCNEIGSRSLQCASDGLCQCKPGVTGDKCDRCAENYFDFGPQGCKPCGCNNAGSRNNEASCDPSSGVCVCKENVEGQQCDQCKPGYFNLAEHNEFGCTPCFCYGHSSICSSASGYSEGVIESGFVRGEERWAAVESTGRSVPVNYNAVMQSLAVSAPGRDKVYFLAPDRFLGDQRASYNNELSFYLRIGELGPQATTEDVILEGAGLAISAPIFAQGNSLPSTQRQKYAFHLHENSKFGWSPRLGSRDLISLLSNLTAIKIRGTYTYEGRGFLDDVSLETARRGLYGVPATWIEMCTCPEGYVGQYCESCAPGYRHSPSNGGPFASCIPCDCNSHADICDSETGRCICQHNTAGEQCERCAKGYYGNALRGTATDCQPCPCPNGGACIPLPDDTVVCLECPTGYAGPRCELCTDSFFGDPLGRHGPPRPCEECDCNGNIDPNAVANCNRTTGECLKCIYNTGGFYCDQCLPGFYGDALALPKGDCQPCYCNAYGTVAENYGPPVCDQVSGQCQCKAHVTSLKCNECEPGYWNLTSGRGCDPCSCDPIGALNNTCNVNTGQCFCREGVTGQKCDVCEAYHYGFSLDGCQPCDCDPVGSVSLQCIATGQCQCRENVDGRRCDRCQENTYDKQAGCRDCPACYLLVLDSVSIHRERLAELERLLQDILIHPTVLNDEIFEETLATVMSQVEELWDDAQEAARSGGDKTVAQHMEELQERIMDVKELLQGIKNAIGLGSDMALQGEHNITQAEGIIQRAREALRNAQLYLDVQGNEALTKAIERSKEFGQQSDRMTQIASEARTLADRQEDDAENIEDVAYEARNTSSEAVTLARKAVDDQRDITDLIKDLDNEVVDIATLHEETLKSANESRVMAKATYLEALAISTDASSIAIPPIDADGLKTEANSLSREAERLKAEAEELRAGRQELMHGVELQLEETTQLVERGREQQQITAELLADTFTAEGQAKDAIRTAEKTLSEAKETLNILEGFDKQVQESYEEAQDALRRVDEIEELIREAEDRTQEAEEALTGAEADAKGARDIAKTAQDTANEASEQAGEVRLKADATKVEASALKDEADQLATRVAATAARVTIYESQVESDEEQVLEAQEKANQAKGRADEASARVREASETAEEIVDLLQRATDLDPSQLDELDRRLKEAWQTYYQSGIETTVSEFTEARNWQQRQITLYEEEIRKLQIEVRNIEEIKISLPDGCYRQIKLEP
ncbi:laminin subunit gamma-1-like isoform X2 [Eriocheir sinensis]|uniref:laminin subunit gamma-1-like isoform X2 n=1 Tax=Eriocheir sinensis TaxID=95602 RepID=UPI0021C634BC|nr:laminin subunit gamma-1-like isoform X2 [Eriocheir sinensis]